MFTHFFIKWANVAGWNGKRRSTDVDFSDLWNSEILKAGPLSLQQLSLCSLKTRSLVWFPKLKPASDSESCGWLLIRIKGELYLLEAKIYNVTSEQPDFERPREANFPSVCNFQAIIPGWPLLRRNNWIELNTHLVLIWEQTQILAREMSPWLSFGWNVTRNWGWLGSLFYFEKTSGGLWFQTRPNGTM